MDDYKWLINEIRESNVYGDATVEKWETAIEKLLKERNVLFECLPKHCGNCKHADVDMRDEPCVHCLLEGKAAWEWRGA